jgi:glutathionylspermidine synthase
MKIAIDRQRVTWRRLREELVLMNLETGAYYTLNETGIIIWEGLVAERAGEDIVEEMVDQFEADRETIIADFERLINELADQGLVTLIDEEITE